MSPLLSMVANMSQRCYALGSCSKWHTTTNKQTFSHDQCHPPLSQQTGYHEELRFLSNSPEWTPYHAEHQLQCLYCRWNLIWKTALWWYQLDSFEQLHAKGNILLDTAKSSVTSNFPPRSSLLGRVLLVEAHGAWICTWICTNNNVNSSKFWTVQKQQHKRRCICSILTQLTNHLNRLLLYSYALSPPRSCVFQGGFEMGGGLHRLRRAVKLELCPSYLSSATHTNFHSNDLSPHSLSLSLFLKSGN